MVLCCCVCVCVCQRDRSSLHQEPWKFAVQLQILLFVPVTVWQTPVDVGIIGVQDGGGGGLFSHNTRVHDIRTHTHSHARKHTSKQTSYKHTNNTTQPSFPPFCDFAFLPLNPYPRHSPQSFGTRNLTAVPRGRDPKSGRCVSERTARPPDFGRIFNPFPGRIQGI